MKDAIAAVRARRAEMNVPPSKKAELIIVTSHAELFGASEFFFKKLASASEVRIQTETPADASSMVSVVTSTAQLYMPMSDLVDMEKELARLRKEADNVRGQMARIEGKLQNPGFVSKAPEAVVASERQRLEGLKAHLAKLEESIGNLK